MPGFELSELPLTREQGGFVQRMVEVGGMTLAHEVVPAGDYGAAGACQTAHWGYVLKGRARVRYADREEFLSAGQAYYLPPGHRIEVLEDSEVIELSPGRPAET